MITLNDLTFTRHLLIDRADRIAHINETCGIGKITSFMYSNFDNYTIHVRTTTNVVLVVDTRNRVCITLYEANKQQIYNFEHKEHSAELLYRLENSIKIAED